MCDHPYFAFKTGLKTETGKDELFYRFGDVAEVDCPFFPVAQAEKKLGHTIPFNRQYMRVVNGDLMLFNSVQIPCGHCPACLAKRSRDWSNRLQIEAANSPQSCFLTLTYRDSCLPKWPSKSDAQRFLKRFRKLIYPRQIRYFLVCERGSKTGRLHFHALIFGYDFADKKFAARGDGGYLRYESPTLRKLWPFGFSELGCVTQQSISYCARYSLKKVGDPTGFCFSLMSKRPPLGIQLFNLDRYKYDSLWLAGRKITLPRIYDRYSEKVNFNLDAIKEKRKQVASAVADTGLYLSGLDKQEYQFTLDDRWRRSSSRALDFEAL